MALKPPPEVKLPRELGKMTAASGWVGGVLLRI